MDQHPRTIEELIGFKYQEPDTQVSEVAVAQFTASVKGKRFGNDAATFISRYGITDYDDHPLQDLYFSHDGKFLLSNCPGPDGGDASVAGEYTIAKVDTNNKYQLVLNQGCKTTFIVDGNMLDTGVTHGHRLR